MLFLLFKNFNVVCIIQYFSELKMFKIIIIILMMMMTFKDQFLLPYTCNIQVLFLSKVFLLCSYIIIIIIIIIITIIIIIIIIIIERNGELYTKASLVGIHYGLQRFFSSHKIDIIKAPRVHFRA